MVRAKADTACGTVTLSSANYPKSVNTEDVLQRGRIACNTERCRKQDCTKREDLFNEFSVMPSTPEFVRRTCLFRQCTVQDVMWIIQNTVDRKKVTIPVHASKNFPDMTHIRYSDNVLLPYYKI